MVEGALSGLTLFTYNNPASMTTYSPLVERNLVHLLYFSQLNEEDESHVRTIIQLRVMSGAVSKVFAKVSAQLPLGLTDVDQVAVAAGNPVDDVGLVASLNLMTQTLAWRQHRLECGSDVESMQNHPPPHTLRPKGHMGASTW